MNEDDKKRIIDQVKFTNDIIKLANEVFKDSRSLDELERKFVNEIFWEELENNRNIN